MRKKSFQCGFVGRLVRDGRLDRDPQTAAHPERVLRHVHLAVIDHDRVREDPFRAQDDVLRDTAERTLGRLCASTPDLRGQALEEHAGHVRRLRSHGTQPDALDRPVVQVHRHRQLGVDPPHRHRLHREHIQPVAVHQDVLTRTLGPQLPQHPLRALRHRPSLLRLTEGVPPLVEFCDPHVGDRLAGRAPVRHLFKERRIGAPDDGLA